MARTFVALDLETTGLDPEKDRITEIGAVRFDETGALAGTFSELVHPGREIPYFIEQLTGVTNEAVRNAPPLAAVAPGLVEFVGEATLVGQNVRFDLECLRREGVRLAAPSIDTARLSRLLLPEEQRRGLKELAGALGVAMETHHRALPDAQTAASVFVALLRRAEALAAGQRLMLARFVGLQEPALAELLAGASWHELPPGERAFPLPTPFEPQPALVRPDHPVEVAAAEVAAAFTAGLRHGFEERPEQLEMAEAVRAAFAGGGHWLVEAGTGVGKSLAYLVPAAIHAVRNGERVIVSTNTINLQEQLLTKDVPALRRMLVESGAIAAPEDLRVAILKGRSNYLCVRRWMAGFAAGIADPDFARLGAAMLLWLPKTETGDRAELNLDHNEWLAWGRFNAQETDCLQRQNPYVRGGHCFLQRARKTAESAHIVIVNHALLLADIASGRSALPAFDHLIVDEAHNLEEQATNQFGATAGRRTIGDALDGLHRRPSRDLREGGLAALLLALPEGAARFAGEAVIESVAKAGASVDPPFRALGALVPRGGDADRLLVSRALRASPDWTAVELAWADLDAALQQVVALAENAAHVVAENTPVEDADVLAGEIATAAGRLEGVRAALQDLVSGGGAGTVTWATGERDGGAFISSAPLDVGPTLQERLFGKLRTVVATSATLAAGGSMAFTAGRLGLPDAGTLQLGSPYDYETATLLAAVTDVAEPNDRSYHVSAARAIVTLVEASRGRALVLFTSHAALRRVAEIARGDLEAAGIVLLAQGVDGPPRQLTENLVANPRTVVFGTSSFWEGVDVRGEALSLLVIARLPFAVPTDPVFKARSEQYERPFGEYALPAALLRFRQGFGRLIRHRDDRGVVAILDRRIYEKSYGSDFLASLPRCTRLKADTATIAQRTAEWLAR